MQHQTRYQKGDKIGGRYLVHQALMGGMGEVYLCLDLTYDLPYALKTFQARYLAHAKVRDYFEREVTTWVALEKHPNVVRCFFLETFNHQPFMVLEWVPGEEGYGTDLRGWLSWRGRLEPRLALDFAIDVCRGLAHADQKRPGVVHCDLKPENVLVARGRLAKITDFGLARVAQGAGLNVVEEGVTTAGRYRSSVGGTPPYMAPEQWRGEAVDARTDVYATGCLLYELLTGRLPFEAGGLDSFRRKHLAAPIPVLSGVDGVSGLLNPVISRCMAKDAAGRYSSAADLLRELSQVYRQLWSHPPRAVAVGSQFSAADHNMRGITFHTLGRYDEALADYTAAIRLDPHQIRAYVNRGTIYEELGRYEEALAECGHALRKDPTDAGAYICRGNIHHAQGRYEEALQDYAQALQSSPEPPDYVNIYFNRGGSYRALNRFEEAIAEYTQAIRVAPHLAKPFCNRGAAYYALGRYDAALADYAEALRLDPSYPEAYMSRGATHHASERYEQALEDYAEAIRLAPDNAKPYINRGATLDELGRYEEALTDYEQAIRLSPNSVEAYGNRGSTYLNLGLYEEALADFAQVIRIAPKGARGYFNMGVAHGQRGDWPKALDAFDKAAELGDPAAADCAARVRRAQGVSSAPRADAGYQAFVAFQKADSAEAMRQAVNQFPVLVRADNIAALERAIAQQIPLRSQPSFQQRLAWLCQIANER